VFFKKRAVLEEEFGRGMQKLAKSAVDQYAMNDGKAGYVSSPPSLYAPYPDLVMFILTSSFVNAWQTTMKIHEIVAENRLRFASRLNEMSEELATLAKEVDKNRKSVYRFIVHEVVVHLWPITPRLRTSQPGMNVVCRIPK
jgi:Rho GTPase-activating protein RGD1